MKKLFLLVFLHLAGTSLWSQIRFDVSKMKKTEVPKLLTDKKPETQYLEMTYGGFSFLNNFNTKEIEGRIIKKIQYVYTDYPKDFDYTELNFQRFAALYVLMPSVFNKPWIEWEIVKQTKCQSSYEASKMFHGFVITFKQGPAPNTLINFTPDVLTKLDAIHSSVDLAPVKSDDDLSNFLCSKEMKISDVKYTNKASGIRMFTQTEPGEFSIVKGLMLTTGSAEGAKGPNNSPSTSFANNVVPSQDKQLLGSLQNTGTSVLLPNYLTSTGSLASAAYLFDQSTVEFDIRINADSLVFKYAFASEEYPEYLEFNDAFGLFITGPGLNDNPKESTLNLATLPDGKTPISVSSINHLKNQEYYTPNDFKTNPKIFKTWQYDGFTKVMTAKVKIKPMQTYHLKFTIADYGDPFYDSAIFIDAFATSAKSRPL